MSHVILLDYLNFSPRLGAGAVLAPTSAVIGRVDAGRGLELKDLATLRADGEHVRIGAGCFFGERATVHIADSLLPTIVGDRVTVGRYALVHACTVGDDCVIGDGAVVMDGAEVGPHSLIAAGALVSPRKRLEGGWLYAGSPAERVRPVTPLEVAQAAEAVRAGLTHPALAGVALPLLAPVMPASRAGAGVLAGVHRDAYVAPNAVLLGDVELGADTSVWFACVLDARAARITVAERSNIQDSSLLTARGGPIVIGPDVTVGHNVRMGACTVEEDCLIGMGCEMEDGVTVERGACIAARAYVESGTVVKAGHIWAGRPAREFRPLKDQERELFRIGRVVYVGYSRTYRGAGGS